MKSLNKMDSKELHKNFQKWSQERPDTPNFIPMTFQSMMTFLCYTTMREKLTEDI